MSYKHYKSYPSYKLYKLNKPYISYKPNKPYKPYKPYWHFVLFDITKEHAKVMCYCQSMSTNSTFIVMWAVDTF